jgi:hypothetical protein
MRAMNMRNSRAQLIAQIQKAEIELYKQRELVKVYQSQLSKNIVPILSFILVISTLVFLFKSKNSFRKIVHTVISTSEVLLLTYFKKEIFQLFEKQ